MVVIFFIPGLVLEVVVDFMFIVVIVVILAIFVIFVSVVVFLLFLLVVVLIFVLIVVSIGLGLPRVIVCGSSVAGKLSTFSYNELEALVSLINDKYLALLSIIKAHRGRGS